MRASPRLFLARILRGTGAVAAHLKSKALILWWRGCYPGLRVGRHIRMGSGVRIRVTNGATLVIGDDTAIEPGCLLHSEGSLIIGPSAFIGAHSTIVAADRIKIGADALIAPGVTIRDQDHRIGNPSLPYNKQGLDTAPVEIGDNVWLGTNAAVLKGVTIGEAAVVAAGAVVTRDVAAATIVAGVPARPMRTLLS